ncbi:MAG: efflux RND transporter periplasmic adaptor subunit [Alphaproteobacteria bacterium]
MRLPVIIAIGIAVAAVAWMGSGMLMDAPAPDPAEGVESGGGATEPAGRFEVRVANLVAEPFVQETALLGHTQANRVVQIASEIDGMVAEVLVEDGTWVEAGAPLIRLQVNDLEARVDEAQALVEQRRIEYNAAAQLGQSGYSARTTVATASANLNAAQAMLTAARQQLARTEIAAPFAGVINKREVELGGYVRAGDPVATLVDLDPIVVVVHVTERQVGDVHVGAVAHASLLGGGTVDGVVRYVSAMAEGATRTFRVDIEVENPDGRIVDGLTADVRVPGRQVLAHRISPAVIALADDGTIGVRIVGEGDTVEFVPIALLEDTTDGIWVDGLPEQVTLITVGQEYVSAGQVVAPVRQPAGPIYETGDAGS